MSTPAPGRVLTGPRGSVYCQCDARLRSMMVGHTGLFQLLRQLQPAHALVLTRLKDRWAGRGKSVGATACPSHILQPLDTYQVAPRRPRQPVILLSNHGIESPCVGLDFHSFQLGLLSRSGLSSCEEQPRPGTSAFTTLPSLIQVDGKSEKEWSSCFLGAGGVSACTTIGLVRQH